MALPWRATALLVLLSATAIACSRDESGGAMRQSDAGGGAAGIDDRADTGRFEEAGSAPAPDAGNGFEAGSDASGADASVAAGKGGQGGRAAGGAGPGSSEGADAAGGSAAAGGAPSTAGGGGDAVWTSAGTDAGNGPVAPPSRWACDADLYGDGICHCGCGVVDVDCADASSDACDDCDLSSCSPFGCEVLPDDNAHCPGPPPAWTCSERLYGDGSRCDCGCGAVDPDCEARGVDACDQCDAPGSCSAQPCPGLIAPELNEHCVQPAPPAEWRCTAAAYGDGLECDCGCGAPDPDCRDAAYGTCVRCLLCGGHGACEGLVDPDDTTQCAPPPAEWLCSADAFQDATCDCGCGLLDSFCQNIELLYVCGNYPEEGCSAGHRSHVDPNHNYQCLVTVPDAWTCDRAYYDDGVCDCGCGSIDLDCSTSDISECEACDDEGSCSVSECPGSIAEGDTGTCVDTPVP